VAAVGTGGAAGWIAYHIHDGRQASDALLAHVQAQCVAALPTPVAPVGGGPGGGDGPAGLMAVDSDGTPLSAAAGAAAGGGGSAASGAAAAAAAAVAAAVAAGGGSGRARMTPEGAAALEEAARLGIAYEQWVLDTWVARALLPRSALLRRRMGTVVRQLDIDMAAAAALIHARSWDAAYKHIMALLRRMAALTAGEGGAATAAGAAGGGGGHRRAAGGGGGGAGGGGPARAGVWRRVAVLSDWLAALASSTPGLPPPAAASLVVDASRAAVDAMLKQYPGAAMCEAARSVAWRGAGVGRHVVRVPYAPLSGAIHAGNLHLLCVNAAERAVAHVPMGGVVGAMALRDVAIDAVPSLLAAAAASAVPAPEAPVTLPPALTGEEDAPPAAAAAPPPTAPPPPPGFANVTVAVTERLGVGALDAAMRKVAAPMEARGMEVRLRDECTPEYTAGLRWWPSPIYAAPVDVAYSAAMPLVQAAGSALQAGVSARLRPAGDTPAPTSAGTDAWGAGFMGQVVALTGKCLALNRDRLAGAEEASPAAASPARPEALALHADVAANTYLFLLLPNLLLWSYREHGFTPATALARAREMVAGGNTGIPPMLQTAWVKLAGAATAAGVSPALADVPRLSPDAALALLTTWRTEMGAVIARLVPHAAAAAAAAVGGTKAARGMKPADWAAAVMHHMVTSEEYAEGGQRAMITSLVAAGAPAEAATAGTFHLWAHSLMAHAFTDIRFVETLVGLYEDEYVAIAAAQAALK